MPAKCPLKDRFWKWVDKSAGPDGCWLWLGATNNKGYGYTGDDSRKKVLAHRTAYTLSGKVLPTDKDLLHSCDNPACVNPKHLFTGTHTDNMRDCAAKGRIWQQKKTNCPKGHPYDEENTYIDKRRHRYCRKCKAARARRDYRRNADAQRAIPEWGEVS